MHLVFETITSTVAATASQTESSATDTVDDDDNNDAGLSVEATSPTETSRNAQASPYATNPTGGVVTAAGGAPDPEAKVAITASYTARPSGAAKSSNTAGTAAGEATLSEEGAPAYEPSFPSQKGSVAEAAVEILVDHFPEGVTEVEKTTYFATLAAVAAAITAKTSSSAAPKSTAAVETVSAAEPTPAVEPVPVTEAARDAGADLAAYVSTAGKAAPTAASFPSETVNVLE